VVEGALIQASIKITVANVGTHVREANSAAMAAVRVRQVITSATAHALIGTSTTTTAENAEMLVLRAQHVPQELAFLTRDNFNILP
jgi:ribosomal protein S12